VVLAAAAGLAAASAAAAQSLAWRVQTDGPVIGSPRLAGGRLYIGSGDGALYALDAATGAHRWKYETGGAVDSTPALDGGRLFVTSRAGAVHAVEADTGRPAWVFRTGGERQADQWDHYLSSPAVHGDLVLVGGGDGKVYALDQASGRPRWSFETGGVVHADPVIAGGLVYVGSFDGVLYALDLATGALRWRFDTEGEQYFPKGEVPKAVLVRDGVVYFGSRDYNLYALDAASGALLWKRKEEGSWVVATPLMTDGDLFFGTSDTHAFYRVRGDGGATVWRLPLNMRVFGSAVAQGDKVYFGASNGRLYAVSAASGAIAWRFDTDGSRQAWDKVFDKADKIRDDLPRRPGEEPWQAKERAILSLGSILGDPVVRDGLVYFGSHDGGVYAVREPQ